LVLTWFHSATASDLGPLGDAETRQDTGEELTMP